MVAEGSKRNGCDVIVMGSKSEARNGFVPGLDNGGGYGMRTYKRRKYSKMSSSSETKCLDDRKASVNSATSLSDKTTKEPFDLGFNNSSCNQDSIARMDSHDFVNGSDDCSLKHWRKIVLEQMYHSLTASEGGLKECIRDALEFHPDSSRTTAVRESVHFGKAMHKCTSQIELMSNGVQNTATGHERVMSNGSLNESNEQTNTELCKRAFFDVLTSENFRELCNLLFDNFPGMRVDRIFDVSSINARMKEGTYESSPMNFHSDIQQVWTKLEKIGTEIVTLAKNLSEKSRTSYCEQVGGLVPGISEDGKNELVIQEPDVHAKPEQTEASAVFRPCTCRQCGEKTEWRDCLVCDSCEEMYHISCTKIPIEEIPPATWYCTTCTEKGALLLHENCVLCGELDSPELPSSDRIQKEKALLKLNWRSNVTEIDWSQEWRRIKTRCHVCRADVKDGEDFRICTYGACPHSRYHVKCLTSKQLNSYGPRWYCPSCLCRACLSDRDDDDIILCDACDCAYHLYCLDPPLNKIPTGTWFCRKCDASVKRIREAREAFEKKMNKEEEEKELKAKKLQKRVEKLRGKGVFEARPVPFEKKMNKEEEEKEFKAKKLQKLVEKPRGKGVFEARPGLRGKGVIEMFEARPVPFEKKMNKEEEEKELKAKRLQKLVLRGKGVFEARAFEKQMNEEEEEEGEEKELQAKKLQKLVEKLREKGVIEARAVPLLCTKNSYKYLEKQRAEGVFEKKTKRRGLVKKRVQNKCMEKSFKHVEVRREEDGLDKSVGVDMLLTAAKTLEEDLGVLR